MRHGSFGAPTFSMFSSIRASHTMRCYDQRLILPSRADIIGISCDLYLNVCIGEKKI